VELRGHWGRKISPDRQRIVFTAVVTDFTVGNGPESLSMEDRYTLGRRRGRGLVPVRPWIKPKEGGGTLKGRSRTEFLGERPGCLRIKCRRNGHDCLTRKKRKREQGRRECYSCPERGKKGYKTAEMLVNGVSNGKEMPKEGLKEEKGQAKRSPCRRKY